MASEWHLLTLGDICNKIGSGATPRGGGKVYLDNGDISLIRSQNVYSSGFTYEGIVYISQNHAEQLNNVTVMQDDILLNITGDSVARCCQVVDDVLPARVNQHVAIIRPDSSILNPRFLRYYLISPSMQQQMLSWADSGGTRKALTKGMIESFEIVAPVDINEQHTIAHILGSLDDKIELNRRMNETLEGIARALFKSWFVDFDPVHARMGNLPFDLNLPPDILNLFPDSFEDSELGMIPKGWKVLQFKDFVKHSNERVGKRNVPEYSSTNEGLVPRSERFKKQLSKSNVRDKIIRENDLVFGLSRQILNFGVMRDPIGSVSPAYKVFTVDTSVVSADYVERYMRQRMEVYFSILGASSREGQSISLQQFNNTGMLVPSEYVQHKFGSIKSDINGMISHNDNESSSLASLRDTLLPKLISGELRVPDAERFIAEAGI